MISRQDPPNYNLCDFRKAMSAWTIFENIEFNQELRLHSRFIHLVTPVSCHIFSICIISNLQQHGLIYFGNRAFLRSVTCICGGLDPLREGDDTFGLDRLRKRVRIEALAYTGTLVIINLLFAAIY